jgi:hypothetical protein
MMRSFMVSTPHQTLLCIIRVIDSVRMRWVGHVACMGRENGHGALLLKYEGREDLYVDEEIYYKGS